MRINFLMLFICFSLIENVTCFAAEDKDIMSINAHKLLTGKNNGNTFEDREYANKPVHYNKNNFEASRQMIQAKINEINEFVNSFNGDSLFSVLEKSAYDQELNDLNQLLISVQHSLSKEQVETKMRSIASKYHPQDD